MQQQESTEQVERKVLYQGHFRLSLYRYRNTLFRGGHSDIIAREIFERGPVVGVLPYDPRRDQVALIRQMRPGALAAGRPTFLWEVIAGIVEPGESPEEVARREAGEEADIEVG